MVGIRPTGQARIALPRLFPGRVADRMILRVTDILDGDTSPSAWARGVMIDWFEVMEGEEGFAPAAKEAGTYAACAGYALRLVEETHGSARRLD